MQNNYKINKTTGVLVIVNDTRMSRRDKTVKSKNVSNRTEWVCSLFRRLSVHSKTWHLFSCILFGLLLTIIPFNISFRPFIAGRPLGPTCSSCSFSISSNSYVRKSDPTNENAGVCILCRWFQNIKSFEQAVKIFHDFSPRNVTAAMTFLVGKIDMWLPLSLSAYQSWKRDRPGLYIVIWRRSLVLKF